MTSKHGSPKRANLIRGFVLASYVLIVLARLGWPERPMMSTGIAAIWDHTFTLLLTLFVALGAYGIGADILRRTSLQEPLEQVEAGLFSLALGLGLFGSLLFFLGVANLFRQLPILLLVGVSLIASWNYWPAILSKIPSYLRSFIQEFAGANLFSKIIYAAILLILGSSFLHTLAPPWSFDALMYHLEAPQQYLELGRLSLLPDVWQANGPMGIDLLYAIGLSVGSASFGRILHWLLTLLLILTCYSMTNRLLGKKYARVAGLVIIAIPILPVWASIANIDSGWALFEALAIYSVIVWVLTNSRGWLRLTAIFLGFALSTKYLALAGALVVGVIVIAAILKLHRRNWKVFLEFVLLTSVIGAPWYLLNLIRAGNPLYPFIWGGPQWDSERIGYLMTYLRSFGPSDKLTGLFFAPVWLYTRRELYTTFMSGIEFPSLLFPLVIFIPFIRPGKSLAWVSTATILRFLVWGIGSQQTRFLLPIFPALSVLTAFVLVKFMESKRWSKISFIIPRSLIGTTLVMTMMLQGLYWIMVRPAGVLTGQESKDSYLRRNSSVYPAQHFIQTELPRSARVLMLWDGQGFYCDHRCLPDAEQSRWTQIVDNTNSLVEVAVELDSAGITHLLGNVDSLNFFLRHDPNGVHTQAANFYLETFRPECVQVVFSSEQAIVDQLVCP